MRSQNKRVDLKRVAQINHDDAIELNNRVVKI